MKQLWCISAGIMAVVTALPAAAQQPAAEWSVATNYVAESVGQRQTKPADMWNKMIAVELDDVTLEEALETIGKAAGVDVTYSRSLIPYRQRITVKPGRVSVRDAFRLSLQGTGTEARLSPNGNVIIARARDSEKAQGTITGRIVNAKTKQPVVGATVLVDDESRGVTTGSDGTFRISAGTGERRITIRAVGFVRQVKTVTATEGETVTIEVALEPSASVLDEVIVTGTVVATERKAIATPITVITAEEIERRGITRIEQFFRGEVPGVIAVDQGTLTYTDDSGRDINHTAVYARGSASLDGSANPMKTYIDGVEMLDPSALGTIDPQSIERIEIITGPQAATIYGSGAMGGVMQIFTKRGNAGGAPVTTLNLRMGLMESTFNDKLTPQHQHSLNVLGGNGPEFSYSADLSYRYTGQWQPFLFTRRYGASVGITHNRGNFTASGSVALNGSRNGTGSGDQGWSFGTMHGSSSSSLLIESLVSEGTIGGRISPPTQRIMDAGSQLMSLNLTYRPTTWWQNTITMGRSQNSTEAAPEMPRFVSNSDSLYRAQESSGSRMTLGYTTTLTPAPTNLFSSSVTLGFNGSSAKRNNTRGCLVSKSSATFIECGTLSTERLTVTSSDDDKQWGGFASIRLGVWDAVFVNVGLRGEHNPRYGKDHAIDWTPTQGITTTFGLGEWTFKLLGSYGRATRPPAATMRDNLVTINSNFDPPQLLQQRANPELRPEYSRGPQGGIEIYYGNRASLTINRYVQNITDLIQPVRIDSIYVRSVNSGNYSYRWTNQYLNVATLRQHGWESQGSVNVGPVTAKGTYSWNDSRITKRFDIRGSQVDNNGFGGLPTHTANVSIGYAHGNTVVNWTTNYVGASIQSYSSSVDYIIRNSVRHREHRDRAYDPAIGLRSQPGYSKSDLVVNHRVRPNVTAMLNVTNVTNNFESDASNVFPTLGRQMLFGISLRR